MSNPKNFVPNVAAKSNAKEMARMQAQIGNLRHQNGQFIIDEEGKTRTLERKGENKPGEVIDLKAIPSIYLSGCKNCHYTIDHRVSKILVENCENTTIVVNGKVLTSCIEVWKCNTINLHCNTKIKTLQCDIMKDMNVVYKTKEDFQSIVWQGVDTIDVKFVEDAELNLPTGFEHMKQKYPDSEMGLDQFIVRFVPELGDGLQPERCVRLKNGHLSTEREAADWDRRNLLAKERFKDEFLKNAGIKLNKEVGVKKVKPNEPCPCGSKKKYKKCCRDKEHLSGLHETQKPVTYQNTKDGVKVQQA